MMAWYHVEYNVQLILKTEAYLMSLLKKKEGITPIMQIKKSSFLVFLCIGPIVI